MNEGLPDPDWKDDVVPAFEMKLMTFILSLLLIILTEFFISLFIWLFTLPPQFFLKLSTLLPELSLDLLIFSLDDCIFNLLKILI